MRVLLFVACLGLLLLIACSSVPTSCKCPAAATPACDPETERLGTQLYRWETCNISCERPVCYNATKPPPETIPASKIGPPRINCQNATEGWQCNVEGNWSADRNSLNMAINLTNEKSEECKKQGGKWTCYGECQIYYTHYCDFLYKDAGRPCTSSSDCSGKCIIASDRITPEMRKGFDQNTRSMNCTKNCIGNCAQYPLRGCDWYFELNNGRIIANDAICD
jgi:hypothetical protein